MIIKNELCSLDCFKMASAAESSSSIQHNELKTKQMENNDSKETQGTAVVLPDQVIHHPAQPVEFIQMDNVNCNQQMSEVTSVVEAIVDVVDMSSRSRTPIYFDPEQDDELIEGKTYFTISFYSTEE